MPGQLKYFTPVSINFNTENARINALKCTTGTDQATENPGFTRLSQMGNHREGPLLLQEKGYFEKGALIAMGRGKVNRQGQPP